MKSFLILKKPMNKADFQPLSIANQQLAEFILILQFFTIHLKNCHDSYIAIQMFLDLHRLD